ncbi:acyltransferase [Psychrobacter faecalis]|uniref:acyltransferase n=1 Tax=Psychrobacter faecalis TaxID=180588 RepID=UPI003FD31C8A
MAWPENWEQCPSILSFEHTWDDSDILIKYNLIKSSQVKICDDVWIGCGVRVLSGVKLKSRSIVAAGAFLTKGVNNNVIIATI